MPSPDVKTAEIHPDPGYFHDCLLPIFSRNFVVLRHFPILSAVYEYSRYLVRQFLIHQPLIILYAPVIRSEVVVGILRFPMSLFGTHLGTDPD